MNFFCTIIIVFALSMCADAITTSLDCISGNQTACMHVRERNGP